MHRPLLLHRQPGACNVWFAALMQTRVVMITSKGQNSYQSSNSEAKQMTSKGQKEFSIW